jgi:serine/threonine-protein kinase
MVNGSFSSENKKPSQYQPLTHDANLLVVVSGRYELLELIGQGAMSRVYRALDRVLDRIVAVKLLREEYGSDENFVARFFREARAVAKISSPNIVDIYDYGQHNNTYFIVMPFIEGTDLKELIRHQGSLPADYAVTIANDILVGLAAAHSNGIIHRDVKPQNIMIRASDSEAKLTDFGVAYALDGVQITTNGMAIGTAYYMAPEQASGGTLGPYTDLYAVGVVLFEMLSGRLPFLADNHMQIMLQHVNDPPPTLRSIGVPVSPELDQVVQKTLMKNPAHRFQNALEMRDALLNIPLMDSLNGPAAGVTSRKKPGPKARPAAYAAPDVSPETGARPLYRRPAVIIPLLLGLLLLLGLGFLGLLLTSNKDRATPTSLVVLPVMTATASAGTVSAPPANSVPLATVSLPAEPLPTVTASPVVQTAAAPTVIPQPTATPVPPTATAVPPTATAVPPTATPIPPTPTRVIPTATAVPPPNPGNFSSSNNSFTPYSLAGSYRRDDGRLYGRPEVALYGSGSGYEQGTYNFKADSLPAVPVVLTLTGLDDERRENNSMQVILNGTQIYNGPSGFPNVPTSDNGEGGADRYWGQFRINVPANLFNAGTNSLVIRNNTPWQGYLGIPYILINQVNITPGQ